MGSLMAGWDSPVSDPKSVLRRRNSSLTKEEIGAYWKSKKKTEEEHLRAISSSSGSTQRKSLFEESGMKFARSSSMPLSGTKVGLLDKDAETNLEDIIKKNGWWTRSNWAFLNEIPVLERSSNSYSAQYHIANLADSKPNRDTGIST